MGDFPYGSDYRSGKPSRQGAVQGVAGKMSLEDRGYMDELAVRVGSNKPKANNAPQSREDSISRPTTRRRAHAARQTVPETYAPRQKKRVAKRKSGRKKGRGLKIFSFIAVLLLLGAASTYYALSQSIKDQDEAPISVMGTLPEFKGDEVNFLVCGIDYDNSDHNGYSSADKIGRTDLLLYVHYNIKENKASILQVPRDTYVGDDTPTGGNYKLNSVYYFAPENSRMKSVIDVFNKQFGLPVDFYLTLDMEALIAIIDHLGYIEMYVPMDITDPENPGSFVAAGVHNLTSEQVQFILRNRTTPGYNDQNDIARLRTQQYFYSALFRVFKQSSPSDVVTWVGIVLKYMKTNTELSDIIGIGLKALSLDSANITFVRPACAPVYYNDKSLVTLIKEDFTDIVNTYFHPLHPPEPFTLPVNESLGVAEAEIKTMGDIQAQEPPAAA